jgi:hypothetical protein
MIYLIIYLFGSILQYFLWRSYHRRNNKWTKGDKVFVLTFGALMSWLGVIWYLGDVIDFSKFIDFDEEAKW